ncbi:MAG: VanZ family protein [Gemmatimonadaceae bacterium]
MALTAVPSIGGRPEDTSPWCVACGPGGGIDFALNVLLYLPFGLGLGALRFRPRSAAAVTVFLTSLATELLQINVISGRDANLGDLIANTAGGLIGVWLGFRWRSLVYPRASESLRLAWIWGLLWLGLIAASTWAVRVNIPEPPWWA